METAAGATGAVADAAAPVGKSAGTSGLGSTFVAVASPLLETTSRAVKACPRSMVDPPSAEARVSEPMARTEGRCTVVLDDAAVAVIAAPLLTSAPVIVAENVSVPEAALASCQVQEKVVLWPGPRVVFPAVAALRTGAPAPPAGATEGEEASGAMACTAAPPALVTTTETGKVWPRLTVAGTVIFESVSRPGSWTVVVADARPETTWVDGEFTSDPRACVAIWSDPAAVPSSTIVQVKVADAPRTISCAGGDAVMVACAPPDGVKAGASGTTPTAVAPPVLETTRLAVKVWPRLRDAGAVKDVTARAGGSCTTAAAVEVALAETVRPVPRSMAETPPEKAMVPVPVPFSTNG